MSPGDGHVAAGRPAGRGDVTGRWPGSPCASTVAPSGGDAVEHGPHRPGPQRRVAVEPVAARRRRGHDRQQEAAGRAREAAVEGRAARAAAGRRCRSRWPGRPRPARPSTPAPSAARHVEHGPVSSATRAPSIVDVPSARAAHSSARLVRLFDPGTDTVASSGWPIGSTSRAARPRPRSCQPSRPAHGRPVAPRRRGRARNTLGTAPLSTSIRARPGGPRSSGRSRGRRC